MLCESEWFAHAMMVAVVVWYSLLLMRGVIR